MLQLLLEYKWRKMGAGFCLLALSGLSLSRAVFADIIFDNTLTSGTTQANTLSGAGQLNIKDTRGVVVNNNLFYSFNKFDVNSNQTAYFDATGQANYDPAVITNIISRVTGGTVSTIDGMIRSTEYANASLWLLNPSGMLFGPNAALDINGSFYAGAASYIDMGSGQFNLYTNQENLQSLQLSSPAAFGFLDYGVSGEINVQDSQLVLKNGQTLGMTANALELNGANISVPNGRVNLIAIEKPFYGSNATVNLKSAQPSISVGGYNYYGTNLNLGDVTIDNSSIDVGSGSLLAAGNKVDVLNSSIKAVDGSVLLSGLSTLPMGATATFYNTGVLVASTSGTVVKGDVNVIDSQVEVIGPEGGDIYIEGGKLYLANSTLHNGVTGTAARYGHTSIAGKEVHITDNSLVQTNNSSSVHTVDAMDISISATDNLTIDDGARVTNDASGDGKSNTFSISSPVINIATGGAISANQSGNGLGDAVYISGDTINLDGGSIEQISSDTSTGGDVAVQAGSLSINSSLITNSVKDSAKGGKISLAAPGITVDNSTIALQGSDTSTGGTTDLEATESLKIQNNSVVSASNSGSAKEGLLKLSSNDISVTDSDIFITVADTSFGAQLELTRLMNTQNPTATATLNITNSHVYTSSFGSAVGGEILLTNDKTTFDSSHLHSHAFDQSQGGALKTETLSSIELKNTTEAMVETQNSAKGGVVSFKSASLTLDNASAIAEAAGSSTGGLLEMSAESISLDQATIATSALEEAQGGDVVLTAGEFSGDTSSLRSVVSGTTSIGGEISLTPDKVQLFDSSVLENQTSGSGTGGRLAINADAIELTDSSVSVTATEQSKGGETKLIGKDLTLTNSDLLVSAANDATGGQLVTNQTGNITFANAAFTNHAVNNSQGGDLSVTAPTIDLNQGVEVSLTHKTENTAQGGTTSLIATNLNVDNYALEVEALDQSSGGLLSLFADTVKISNNGSLTSTASGSATGVDLLLTGNSIVLEDNAKLTSSANGSAMGGGVAVNARNLTIDKAIITSEVTDNAKGGDITLNTEETLTVSNNSVIQSKGAVANGVSGEISLKAKDMQINSGSLVKNEVVSSTQGAAINLEVTRNLSLDGQATKIASLNKSSAKGGDITIKGGTVDLTNFAEIRTQNDNSGAGGNIKVSASGVSLDTNAAMTSLTTGAGQGGDIDIVTTAAVTISSLLPLAATNAGDITLSNGAQLTSSSIGSADSGTLALSAGRDLLVNSGAKILSSSGGFGNGSPINLSARNINLDNGSVESTASFAKGGDINLNASGLVQLLTDASIAARHQGISSSEAASSEATSIIGAAGKINLNAKFITLEDAAKIISDVAGNAEGGKIYLLSDNGLNILGKESLIQSRTTGAGRGADIDLADKAAISISDVSKIVSQTTGAGAGGDICIVAPTVKIEQNSSLQALSAGLGATGAICVGVCGPQTANTVIIVDSQIISDGGDVELFANQLLDIVNSTITTDSGQGDTTNFTALSDVNTAPNADNSRLTLTTKDLHVEGSQLKGKNLDLLYSELVQPSDMFVTPLSNPELPESETETETPKFEERVDNQALSKDEEDQPVVLEEPFLRPLVVSSHNCAPSQSGDKSSFVVGQQAQISASPDSYKGSTYSHIKDQSVVDLTEDAAAMGYLAAAPCDNE